MAVTVGPGRVVGVDFEGGVAAGGQHAVAGEEDDVASSVRGNGRATPLAVIGPLQLK